MSNLERWYKDPTNALVINHEHGDFAATAMVYGAELTDLRAEVAALSRQLAGAVDALREYGGHRDDCNALSGAPDCSCGFDEAMLRALGRAGVH